MLSTVLLGNDVGWVFTYNYFLQYSHFILAVKLEISSPVSLLWAIGVGRFDFEHEVALLTRVRVKIRPPLQN